MIQKQQSSIESPKGTARQARQLGLGDMQGEGRVVVESEKASQQGVIYQ